MIVDIFAGFLIICALILLAYITSLAITFWFISIPLAIVWFIWMLRREDKRQRSITPEQRAAKQAELERRRLRKARQDAMVREALRQISGE